MPSLSTVLIAVSIWLAASLVTALGLGALINRGKRRAKHRRPTRADINRAVVLGVELGHLEVSRVVNGLPRYRLTDAVRAHLAGCVR